MKWQKKTKNKFNFCEENRKRKTSVIAFLTYVTRDCVCNEDLCAVYSQKWICFPKFAFRTFPIRWNHNGKHYLHEMHARHNLTFYLISIFLYFHFYSNRFGMPTNAILYCCFLFYLLEMWTQNHVFAFELIRIKIDWIISLAAVRPPNKVCFIIIGTANSNRSFDLRIHISSVPLATTHW